MTAPRRPPPDPADAERDAYLQGALRHAPDADVAPPASLSEAILREARGATSTRVEPVRGWDAVLAFWSWLARPPVAAGFASLMVATLAGVMWWGQPIEAPRDEAPARSSAPAPASPPAAEKGAEAADAAPAPVAPPSADRALKARRDAAAPGTMAKQSTTSAPAPKSRSSTSAPAGPLELAAKRKLEVQIEPPTVAPAAPVPEPVQAPQAQQVPPVPQQMPSASVKEDKAVGSVTTGAASATEAARRDARAEATNRGAPTAKAESEVLSRERQRVDGLGLRLQSSPRLPGVSVLSAQIATQPDRWQWRWAGTETRPVSTAFQQWLTRLDGVVGRQWRASESNQPNDPAATLELWRDGVLHSTLQLSADSVNWITAENPNRPLSAALTPAAMLELKAALEAMRR
jgi:hypothetical protein